MNISNKPDELLSVCAPESPNRHIKILRRFAPQTDK